MAKLSEVVKEMDDYATKDKDKFENYKQTEKNIIYKLGNIENYDETNDNFETSLKAFLTKMYENRPDEHFFRLVSRSDIKHNFKKEYPLEILDHQLNSSSSLNRERCNLIKGVIKKLNNEANLRKENVHTEEKKIIKKSEVVTEKNTISSVKQAKKRESSNGYKEKDKIEQSKKKEENKRDFYKNHLIVPLTKFDDNVIKQTCNNLESYTTILNVMNHSKQQIEKTNKLINQLPTTIKEYQANIDININNKNEYSKQLKDKQNELKKMQKEVGELSAGALKNLGSNEEKIRNAYENAQHFETENETVLKVAKQNYEDIKKIKKCFDAVDNGEAAEVENLNYEITQWESMRSWFGNLKSEYKIQLNDKEKTRKFHVYYFLFYVAENWVSQKKLIEKISKYNNLLKEKNEVEKEYNKNLKNLKTLENEKAKKERELKLSEANMDRSKGDFEQSSELLKNYKERIEKLISNVEKFNLEKVSEIPNYIEKKLIDEAFEKMENYKTDILNILNELLTPISRQENIDIAEITTIKGEFDSWKNNYYKLVI